MPFTTIQDVRASDLIISEEVEGYYSRDTLYVNPTVTGNYSFGTVLFRAKAVDDSVTWDVLDAAGELSIANEYAILIGNKDGIQSNSTITLTNGTSTPVLALARDASVKAPLIDALTQISGFTTANKRDLKGLLRKNSGIKVIEQATAV